MIFNYVYYQLLFAPNIQNEHSLEIFSFGLKTDFIKLHLNKFGCIFLIEKYYFYSWIGF